MVDEKSKTPPSPTAVEVPPDHEAGNGPPQRDKPEPITTTATTQIQSPSPSPVAVQDSQQDAQGPLAPSTAWTGHQLFYIFGLDGVGAMGLSGGVNFAIAYAMYTTQDTAKNPIRLFSFPNTLAGDAAVTIIIQCLLTWFVEWGLVAYDLSNRSVQPIGFIPVPTSPLARWFFFLPPAAAAEDPESASPSTTSDAGPGPSAAPTSLAAATTLSARLLLVIQQALRAMTICVPAFLVVWPVAVGAMTAAGRPLANHDYLYDDRWAPQVFKLLLGGVLSLLTTPLMAMYWLVRAGWAADAAAA